MSCKDVVVTSGYLHHWYSPVQDELGRPTGPKGQMGWKEAIWSRQYEAREKAVNTEQYIRTELSRVQVTPNQARMCKRSPGCSLTSSSMLHCMEHNSAMPPLVKLCFS